MASIGYFLSNLLGHKSHASSTVWPSAHLSVADAARLPVDAVVVATTERRARSNAHGPHSSGRSPSRAHRSRSRLPPVRRAAAHDGPGHDRGHHRGQPRHRRLQSRRGYRRRVGRAQTSVQLLRLTGVPTALLHRVVALESALPLLIVAAVSIAVGLVSAALYLNSQVGIAFSIPGIAYWATVFGGLAASLAIIACTFPLLNRITGPEVARND